MDDVGPWQDDTLIAELELERHNKARKNKTDSSIIMESGDLVQRQSSTLSIETEYEDALTTLQLDDNSAHQKSMDTLAAANIPTMSGIPARLSDLPPIASKSMSLASETTSCFVYT